MKVLGRDPSQGSVKMRVETEDDLWHLYNIVEPGDLVVASTYRREERKSDKIRAEKVEKRRMTLGIRVEKVEFHDFDLRLRLLGVIETGPQDIGSHHTLNVEEGETLTVIKEWRQSQLDRVRRAVEDADQPQIVFVAMDNEEATIAVMRQYGVREVATIRSTSSGKMYAGRDEGDYLGEVVTKVLQTCKGAPIAIVGPGFAKEHLLTRGRLEDPDAFSRARVYHTGQSGMAGIHEMMKRGLGKDVLETCRVAMEVELVERVLEGIATDGLVTYGPKEVRQAADAGAVETLVILDSLIRDGEMEGLMRDVEALRGKVVVVSEQHDAGRELDSIGGVAAILRYAVA